MYTSFEVQNFRGLPNLKIEHLKRVNLIAGKNNVGKTTLLEALWLHHAPNLPDLGLRINAFRGLEGFDAHELFHELFWNFDSEIEIELAAFGSWGEGRKVLKIELLEVDVSVSNIDPSGNNRPQEQTSGTSLISDKRIVLDYTDETGKQFKSEGWAVEAQISPGVLRQSLSSRRAAVGKRATGIYLPSRHRSNPQEDAERFGKLEIVGKHSRVVSLLKHVEPRLEQLTIIPRASIPMLHAKLKGYGRLLPLPLLGDGMARLASLALAIANAEDGIVLVDEVENGLHHTVMKKVWSGIAQFAREFNVQIFATTHSAECVKAAHEAFSDEKKYDFRLHRLERKRDTDDIRVVTYDQETLEAALELGLEFR
ncbi:MAG: AAA family ATPase [Chloroflexi bacterium]|nr:AAA family ATPase [Chloroflexota bacterium]